MRPDRETLTNLYETQRLTTREIGRRYNVSKTHVLRWLRFYEIDRRPSHNGLANRGVDAPTPEELTRLVHIEHRSYPEIAALFGVDSTAVPYWLRKHGIARPTIWSTRYGADPPVLPPVDELAALYTQGLTLGEIGRRFGVSALPITTRLKAAGVEIRRDGWGGGKRHRCADGHAVRSTYEQRVDDWLSEHGVDHVYEPQLPWDRRLHADFLAGDWYIEIWGIKNDPRYTTRRERKRALYRAHAAPLIEIDLYAFATKARGRWQRRLAVITHPSPALPAAAPEERASPTCLMSGE